MRAENGKQVNKLKAEYDLGNGQTLELDTDAIEARLGEKLGAQMKEYFKELKEWRKEKAKNGKGVVERYTAEEQQKNQRVIEAFKKGKHMNSQDRATINEQWTITVPKYARYELAGHLRDYVWVTDVVKGKQGETVNFFNQCWS